MRMIELTASSIALKAAPANKSEAICLAGALLVKSGHMQAGYVESMLSREQVANTYLGNGIAIPHGLSKDRALINKTGISVLQVPGGVMWNPGETAHLVIGIAACSDEHIALLAHLATVLAGEERVRRLTQTEDAGEIIAALVGAKCMPSAAPPEALADFDHYTEAMIVGSTGLHARPATAFITLAKRFEAKIHVRYQEKVANGRSLTSLLRLGVPGGGVIRVMAQGDDADIALVALKEAVESGLNEEAEAEKPLAIHTWVPARPAKTVIRGFSASPGLAIAPICQFQRSRIIIAATTKDPNAELQHLKQSIETAKVQLQEVYNEVKMCSGSGQAAIFLAQAEFLDDPELFAAAAASIKSWHSAARAWREAVEEQAKTLEQLPAPLFSRRAVDLRDAGRRVLRLLADSVEDKDSVPEKPSILVAEDLTPSDIARLDPAIILGFCTASGGPTSHTAIIARSLGIPAVVGAGPAVLDQPNGAMAILDGNAGSLYVEPHEADIETARQALEVQHDTARFEPAIMRDGHRIAVVANISRATEAEQAVNAGGEGVGLLRTEFLFLERDRPPTEEEQFEAYQTMVRALNGLPLIIRTLDIGGDKKTPYLNLPSEENSFLGMRGIRLCLARPELFRPQLRAIFRVAKLGPVKILFPMISTLEDLWAAKELAEEVRRQLCTEPVEIGIMIEVPSTAMLADLFAQEVDFFSIGTNDLTPYVLAMDRLHPLLARQADGLHPAVLRMIERTVQAANAAGKWVGVCGEIAGDPKGVVILAGLGVRELSVSIPRIAPIKAQLRSLKLSDAQALAKRALSCRTAAEVRALA
jgi:phosphocarrier protein FPr